MIQLYHGSNMAIEQIDLSKGRKGKDFGQGFYLTDIKQQALDMAVRRTKIVGSGTPTVTSYLFDETLMKSGELKVLTFDKPDVSWAMFIVKNRMSDKTGYKHDYDIVFGPVADDGVLLSISLYVDRVISEKDLVGRLTYKKLSNQYFFGTERAISKLKKL